MILPVSKTSPKGTDRQQRAYYSEEWRHLALSDKPGRSGWRTTVPAPDFVEFVGWLKRQKVSGRALDLGCGGGRHSILLAQAGFEVFGLDFAESAITVAAKNASDAGIAGVTHFETGNALALPYHDDYFDLVNDDGCLHHINPMDWPIYTRGVDKIIKRGGIFRIKAFSKNCEYFRQNSPDGTQWVRLSDSGYTYFFSEQDIHRLFGNDYKFLKLEEKVHTQAGDKKFFFVVLRKPQIKA
jgi:ubiquinone/menaquinone biosynthesis C-methylase UbiE